MLFYHQQVYGHLKTSFPPGLQTWRRYRGWEFGRVESFLRWYARLLIGVTEVQIFSSFTPRPPSRPQPLLWHCGYGWTALSVRNWLKMLVFATLPIWGTRPPSRSIWDVPKDPSQTWSGWQVLPQYCWHDSFASRCIRAASSLLHRCLCIASRCLAAETRGVAGSLYGPIGPPTPIEPNRFQGPIE